MTKLTSTGMLELWERGAQRHPLDRALLLLAGACPGEPLPDLADVPIGQRDQTLIAWRSALFGRALPGYADCPECHTRLTFALDASAFLGKASDAPIVVDGLQVRRPSSRDLAEALNETDPEQATYRLAQRCCGGVGELPMLNPAQLARIETALAEADAAADIVLDFSCDHCGHGWQTAFDIGGYLWQEIEAHASRLLADIHTLASTYGWSEREVLALSPTRRAAYIDMVSA